MKELKPKLFTCMKGYNGKQFVNDVVSGIIVAIIALPLSIALAIASGVGPEEGLYTAIVAGFLIAFFGGSRVQIAGPTAAFATIVAGIVAKNGMDGLVIATILAGIILVFMGIFHFGSLIKYIPYTITVGFTAGIAVTLAIGQIKDFLGLTFSKSVIETVDKVEQIVTNIDTLNTNALLIGLLALVILIIWPKIKYVSKVPASLVAVIVTAAVVKLADLDVNTIGGLYEISSKIKAPHMPDVTFSAVRQLLPDAFTIALLAGIESLLSCVVSDGMIGSKHRPNAELIGQGIGNIGSALFGGIPATGAIARTAANVKNGGRTPVAGMVHSVVLLLVLMFLMPYAGLIPMPAIAAILFMVAFNMCGYKEFIKILKSAPKMDIIVLVVTFALTVIFDLVVAIEIGVVLAAFLFMKRMADTSQIRGWKYISEDGDEDPDDKDAIGLKKVPKNTLVYEITGPMFFAATDKFLELNLDPSTDCIVLRMRAVPAMDASALHTFQGILETCNKRKIKLVFSHVNEQPMQMMRKAGFDKKVGVENFCENIDAALIRAAEIVK